MMANKKLSAIILARSGSKGIKNKNLKKIGGKSLIEFSIQSAKKSKYVKNIFLSSDSKEYLELSEKLGAKKIMRPHSLADDFSSSEDALIHAIKEIEESNQQLSEYIIFIQCTSPFTTGKDIDNAFEYFVSSNFDSLFSGKVFHRFLWSQSTVEGINNGQKLVRQRRQDVD
jgi:CMP-N-acetylneuraminic acid synthetase